MEMVLKRETKTDTRFRQDKYTADIATDVMIA